MELAALRIVADVRAALRDRAANAPDRGAERLFRMPKVIG